MSEDNRGDIPSKSDSAGTAARTVLVVDDDQRIRDLLAETLEALDYRAITASDGREGLAALDANRIDVVITDIRMPNMSGIELLQQIKAERPDMPVILISGFDDERLRRERESSPADGFLAKPFRLEKIERLLDHVLNGIPPGDDNVGRRDANGRRRPIEHILLIEDDPDFLDLMRDVLEPTGYRTTGVDSAESALERLESETFDAVVTDFKLPEKSGTEVLKAIKSDHPDLPVVMITGHVPSMFEREFDAVRPDGFLMKPFRLDQFCELMRQLGGT